MEYLQFALRCLKRGFKNTWAWSEENKLWLSLYFALASAVVLGIRSASVPKWEAFMDSAVGGVLIILLLIFSVAVVESVKAPTQFRNEALQPPSFGFTVHIRNDVLHREWASLKEKLDWYQQVAQHRDNGPVNSENADKALANLIKRIEDFGSFSYMITLDKVSIKRRRAARKMYRSIRGVTHESNFELIEDELKKFSETW